MSALRIGLPAGIALAGIVLLAVGGGEATTGLGLTLLGVAVLVVLANLYVRLSIASQRDRDREAAARRTFSRTGRWPAGR